MFDGHMHKMQLAYHGSSQFEWIRIAQPQRPIQFIDRASNRFPRRQKSLEIAFKVGIFQTCFARSFNSSGKPASVSSVYTICRKCANVSAQSSQGCEVAYSLIKPLRS